MKTLIPNSCVKTFTYIFNAMGDYVADEHGAPAFYDKTKANELLSICETWSGAEFAIVMRNGVLGILAEQMFTGSSYKPVVTDKVLPFFEKYNGTESISVGILDVEMNCVWPQLFIPASVVLNNPSLTDKSISEFALTLEAIAA